MFDLKPGFSIFGDNESGENSLFRFSSDEHLHYELNDRSKHVILNINVDGNLNKLQIYIKPTLDSEGVEVACCGYGTNYPKLGATSSSLLWDD